jgi:hypothetical protein
MKFVAKWAAAAIVFGFVAPAAAVTVTIPDPSPQQFISLGSGDASVTYDSVVFTQSSALSDGNFFNVGPLYSGVPAVLSSQEQSTGVPNILITLPEATTTFSVGFTTFDGSDVTFLLSNGGSFVQSSSAGGYQITDLFSVTSTPFTTVLITTSDSDGLSINDITYGAVPEPATWAMMMVGFAGLGAAAGLRRKSPHLVA